MKHKKPTRGALPADIEAKFNRLEDLTSTETFTAADHAEYDSLLAQVQPFLKATPSAVEMRSTAILPAASREVRYVPAEVRSDTAGNVISGYAAVFNSLSADLGGFKERIVPGAFKNALQKKADVRCLVNHEPSQVLGRTSSGTLTLEEDSKGLKFRCQLPNTSYARDVVESIKRGDMSQCSFGFSVNEQRWLESKDKDQPTIRELVDVDLFDVSVVTYPAYDDTSVAARNLWPQGVPAAIVEFRSRATALDSGITLTHPELMRRASDLLSKKPYTKEIEAEFRSVLALDERITLGDRDSWQDRAKLKIQATGVEPRADHNKAWRFYLNTGIEQPLSKVMEQRRQAFEALSPEEQRDMTVATANLGGDLVPDQFSGAVMMAMKQYDRLFDPGIVTTIYTGNGGPFSYPLADDTANSAAVFTEGQQDTEADATLDARVDLTEASSFRTSFVKVSTEFEQDSGIPIDKFLSKAFGVQWARGIGASIVSAILAKATLGRTATGSSTNDGSSNSGQTSIGTDDLSALQASVNSAYWNSPSTGWAMNPSTLTFLIGLKDKQGRLIFPANYNDQGDFILLGKPVFLCPSLPAIATTLKTVLFGDFQFLICRYVRSSMIISRFGERFIDFGQIAFRGILKMSAGLGKGSAADSPIKYLQQA